MNINLDISGPKDIIYVDKNDTSESIVFNIKDNGVAVDLTGLTLSFILKRTSYIVAPLTITSAVNGTATLTLTSAMVSSSGTIVFEIVGMRANNTTAFDVSSYLVVQNVYSGDDGQNDPDEENPGIDVLYGEEAPDDDEGEDKDFYLRLGGEGTSDIISNTDVELISDTGHPMTLTDWSRSSRNQFSFNLSGNPDGERHGENAIFPLHNCIEGETYTISLKGQFTQVSSFYQVSANGIVNLSNDDLIIIFEDDRNEHVYTGSFTYVEGLKLDFIFFKVTDNTNYTFKVTDFTITGVFYTDIEEIYSKYEDAWRKYTPPTMKGATDQENGAEGFVPQPLIEDKDKVLKGDGTWVALSKTIEELTDVDINNPQANDVLKYAPLSQTWYNEALTLFGLTDVFYNQPTDGDVLTWNETLGYWTSGSGGASSVSITPTLLSGVKIADYSINGTPGSLYAPSGGGGSGINYSENEQVVGTWIDGKPVYQKTFSKTLSGTVANISLSGLNVKKAWIKDGFYDIGVTCLGINEFMTSSTYTWTHINPGLNPPYIDCKNTISQNSTVYITLLYTKTTD